MVFRESLEVNEYYFADDPCELVNLAEDEPELVVILRDRLEDLRAQAAPVDVKAFIPDPEAMPALHGGIWAPFL